MGDRKPSQFLRRLRALAQDKISDEVLGTLWLGRLPHNLQAVLVAHQTKPLESQAEIVDAHADAMERGVRTTGTPMNGEFPNLEEMLSRILARVSLMFDEKFASYQVTLLEEIRKP